MTANTIQMHKIRIIRMTKGFSQDYVASKLEITQQAYSNIEKNPCNTTLKRLKEIALVLEVDLTFLLDENMEEPVSESIKTYERLIMELKEEIAFLRNLLEARNS